MIKKEVNCIIPAYNAARYLPDAISSVVNQNIGFDNINLVIVNDGSTDNTEEIVEAYKYFYPDIICINQENQGVSAARNAGLDYCMANSTAPFTCFLDADDKYDLHHMKVLTKVLEDNDDESELITPDVAFIPIKIFERETGVHYAYKAIDRGATRVIDLEEESVFFHHVNAGMFKTSAVADVRFNEALSISEDADFILKVLLKTNLVAWHNEKTVYHLRKRADESSAIDNADSNPALYKRISYYREEFENYIRTTGAVPRAVQASRLYDIHWFKQSKANPIKYDFDFDNNKAISDVEYIIHCINDDLLEQEYIPYWHRTYFKQIKYGKIHLRSVNNEIEPKYYVGGYPLETVAGDVPIQFINQRSNIIHIRGFFVKPMYEGLRLVALYGGVETEGKMTISTFNDKKQFLGQQLFPAMDIEFKINLEKAKEDHVQSLEFYFVYNGRYSPARLTHTWSSRFYYGNKFFIGDNAIIRTSAARHVLRVETLKKDFLNQIIIEEMEDFEDKYLLQKYMEYYAEYRNKRIWLFIDRHNRIDDNAEALFRHCCNIKDGIEKFMIIPDGSYYKNFEGVNPNIIIYGSFEYKFLLLFAEKCISSTTFYDYNVATNIPKYKFRKIVDAFSNFEEIFLQHGITQNIGVFKNYLNNTRRDLLLFFAASKKEYQSILKNSGFTKEQVKLTGFPRYDLLNNKPQRVVTLAFSWRASLGDEDERAYNPYFKKTLFFKMFNDFITDDRLLSTLREGNYRFIVKLHPELYVQKEDFTFLEGVEVVVDEISYRELFEISSVMITDYSSVVFDFAYLKKPIIYYQDSKSPSCYGEEDKGETFDYDKDGFGDVVYDKDACVDKLIEYLERGCKMEEMYLNRVDRFFAFYDRKNSKRVYKEIMKTPKRTRNKII